MKLKSNDGIFGLKLKNIHRFIRKASSRKSFSLSRTVFVGHKHPPGSEDEVEERFPDNIIVTSKYTIWNFIPKNLYEQFRRIANFYFLCIAVIQLSINSPVSPLTSLAPLVFVVTITAVKQGYEDWLRHKADRIVNHMHVRVIKNGKITRTKSQNIQVGDIVKVKSDEEFPCDLVMLSSSNTEGVCYITTANLDGETNLKVHECLPETRDYQTAESFSSFCASIECEEPTANLYTFIGRMTCYKNIQETSVGSLGPVNLLLKGARLKNTNFIYGCCVYSGPETKLSLNLNLTYNKFSTVERSMNKFLIFFLVLLAVEVTLATGMKYFYQNDPVRGIPWYLPVDDSISAKGVLSDLLVFVVLFNYIIPISLYVTIEMVKFTGSLFLTWDAELYDSSSNEYAKCNSSDLNEELGQVQYLFTDKTGTLTENDMVFRHCSIDSIKYTEFSGMLCKVSESQEGNPEPLFHYVGAVENFLLALAVCNTVQTFNNGSLSQLNNFHNSSNLEYHASSPDEKALVDACWRLGVILHGVFNDTYYVTFKGKLHKFERLHILEFDFNRKCMSVIIRNEEGNIYLLCKGAESTVISKCVSGPKIETLAHVNDYALEGLRVLVVAHKQLSEAEFQNVDIKIKTARAEMVDREQKVLRVFDEIEQNMTLLGATAVEDRLQEGVYDTLSALKEAGIKVWVLTGDKEETAINVSYLSGHFQKGMELLKLVCQRTSSQCHKKLNKIKVLIEKEPLKNYALVVDGHTLTFLLSELRDNFYKVCCQCSSVLCCRMSPIQKAEIVKFIKNGSEKVVTAAVGDGANDVSMIQEAHVGLGIIGKEGRQAVRCSDFAFARFRFLLRVLLVHGHYYYIRISTLVQYFFYKNIAFIIPQAYFASYSAFSSQPIYHSFYLMFYNIFFTSLPILVFGLTEQHLSQKLLLNKPHLYRSIRRNAKMTKLQFTKWIIQGFWHSLVLYFGTHLFWIKNTTCFLDGQSLGSWSFGTLVFHMLVFIVNLKLCLHTRYWTKLFLFSLLITILGFMGFNFLCSGVIWNSNVMFWVYMKLLLSPSFWLLSVIVTVTALLPDILILLKDEYSFTLRNISDRTKQYSSMNSSTTQSTLLVNRRPLITQKESFQDDNYEARKKQMKWSSESYDNTKDFLLEHKNKSRYRGDDQQRRIRKVVIHTPSWFTETKSTGQEETRILESEL
ncbi:phospholipid-transporting ATPase IF-like isoform X1 [Tachypleus tridentatus]|uniref:phospholipid-transporting ATPase IF-like isoform X1 n=2 Tax=Tachypleus tridentatus TaxID=6853 RepID=UPI003FD16A94